MLMKETDGVNRLVLAMLAILGAILEVVGWYRFIA